MSMAVTVAFLVAVAGPVQAGARGGGPLLKAVRVAGHLAAPTGFTFARDGRIVYGERFKGRIRILDPATGADHVVYRVSNVDGAGDRGLLGVALHPDYPDPAFVYAFVTRHTPAGSRNQVIRITNEGGHGTDLRVLVSANAGPQHQGGRIQFGPDGMLYVALGDGDRPADAQDRASPRGKILRMTPWGAPAPGNPFPHSRVWSFGHRNSFGFGFDPKTGNLWETENGPHCNDELNRIVAGGNFAWGPHEDEDCVPALPGALETNRDGPSPRRQPEAEWTPTIAPTGIAFCDGCGLGSAFAGRGLIADFNHSEITRITLSGNRRHVTGRSVVFEAPHPITSVEVGSDSAIYISLPAGIYRLAPA